MDRRKKRTSTNQYMLYIDLMEKDPIFASGKVPRDMDMNYLTKQWKELSDKLNQCSSGPTLTADEWRKRLNDWKNTTRSKYRRSLSGEKDTSMTQLEMRALELFGKAPNITTADQVSIHLKSEKDDGDDEMEHHRTSESFQKELQAAVEEAIGGEDDEDAMVEEHVDHEDDILEEALTTGGPIANTSAAAESGGEADGGAYRTIVVENTAFVDEHGDEQLEYITPRRVQAASTANVQNNAKLINGGIPLKRLRTQTHEQIVYEVKNQAQQQRGYATVQATATPIAIHHSKPVSGEAMNSLSIDAHNAREIAHQLKRLADIKYEKLRFEISRFKFNNPGYQYNLPPAL